MQQHEPALKFCVAFSNNNKNSLKNEKRIPSPSRFLQNGVECTLMYTLCVPAFAAGD